MYYNVLDDRDFDFHALKRNKEVMAVFKEKAVYVTVDKFQRQAVKKVGFLVGLHTKLTQWGDLQDKIQRLVNEAGSELTPIDTLCKSVWVDLKEDD